MSVQNINPEEASRLMDEEDYSYIDVRSIPEFTEGHPQNALNIPILHKDVATEQMIPNDDFLKVVEANFPQNCKLILGCQAGQRSAYAAETLEKSGYKDVRNMAGGFGGAKDAMGRLVQKGWAELGLPVSDDSREGVSYESLEAKDQK